MSTGYAPNPLMSSHISSRTPPFPPHLEREIETEEKNRTTSPSYPGNESQIPLNLTTTRVSVKLEDEITCSKPNHVIDTPAPALVVSPAKEFRRNGKNPSPDFIVDRRNPMETHTVPHPRPYAPDYGGFYPHLSPRIDMAAPVGALQFMSPTPVPHSPHPVVVSITAEVNNREASIFRVTPSNAVRRIGQNMIL